MTENNDSTEQSSSTVNKTPQGVVDRDDDYMDERYGSE